MSDYCAWCLRELDDIWCGHPQHDSCKEHCEKESQWLEKEKEK